VTVVPALHRVDQGFQETLLYSGEQVAYLPTLTKSDGLEEYLCK
jgi:hypothetical protein